VLLKLYMLMAVEAVAVVLLLGMKALAVVAVVN
jgi:hypothetical protein